MRSVVFRKRLNIRDKREVRNMEKSWMLVDEKVIQDAINKEENAINLIYEQTINSAYFVAQTHACNISYINDILQDSYIRVFEHLDTLHDYTKLQSLVLCQDLVQVKMRNFSPF